MCQRQIYFKGRFGNKVWGNDLPMRSIEMLINKFEHLSFGGQLSDPIHYPKFIEVLKMCSNKNVEVRVQTASSFKPISWYKKAFEAYPQADWQFGLDGLPEESHKYRKNQDGKKIFQVMLEGKNILTRAPIWQYIVFKYNETHQRQAKRMAKENGLRFVIMKSSRWVSDNKDVHGVYDELLPSKKNRLGTTFAKSI
tara:strand:- start:582 stop:1169 length:588 start_codon:yes stop_codon:yes gene_type:complete